MSSLVHSGEPFSQQKTSQILDELDREGFASLPGILTPDEVENLKVRYDRVFADPKSVETDNVYPNDWSGLRLFETDPMFVDMLVREPIISLAESICGEECHLIADGAVRNYPGVAIDSWHVDDDVFLPLPEGVSQHDPAIPFPVYQLTCQILLTDVPSVEYGPTEFVPGSHRAGRRPEKKGTPTFNGQGPVPIFGKAGDIYLQNGQTWHRGAPNTSDRTRCLYQISYGRRWVSQRFYPFLNYRMPDHVLEGADERLLRVLGKHPQGAYG